MNQARILLASVHVALLGVACAQQTPEPAQRSFRDIELIAPSGASVLLQVPGDLMDWRNPVLSGRQDDASPIQMGAISFEYDTEQLETIAIECSNQSKVEYPIIWTIGVSNPGYMSRRITIRFYGNRHVRSESSIAALEVFEEALPNDGPYIRSISLSGSIGGTQVEGPCRIYRGYPEDHIINRCELASTLDQNRHDIDVTLRVDMPYAYVEQFPMILECLTAITTEWVSEP